MATARCAEGRRSAKCQGLAPKQGQYHAYTHAYTKVNRQAPAETDTAKLFGLAPPSVHRMLVELEQRGLIARTPGAA